jgi:transposase
MIPISPSARIWIATGYTDMRKSMPGCHDWCRKALVVIHPLAMSLFRGRSSSLIKALWHDGVG